MRFLLVTVGTAGDILPFVALGRRLADRGHRVSVVTHSLYGHWVRNAQLDFVDLEDEEPHRAMLEHPWFGNPALSSVATTGWVVDSMRRQFRKIDEAFDSSETIVVSLIIAFGARIFEELRGAQHFSVLLAPMALRSRYRPSRMPFGWWPRWTPPIVNSLIYRAIDAIGLDRALGGINAFRQELGLRPTSRFLHDWWPAPRGILGLFPEWFAAPIPPDWPPQLRMTGFPLFDASDGAPLPTEIEAFLDAGPRPVVVSGGSWLRDPRFYQAAMEGCLRANLRCLVQTPFRHLLTETLPAGVLHAGYVPFGLLMPRAAALVHHGGIGTFSQALAAGIPQVVVPQNFDQRDNAARLTALGVAAWPSNGRVRPAQVQRSLQRLLSDPETAQNCQRLAERTRTDALEPACELLEQGFRFHSRGSPLERAR